MLEAICHPNEQEFKKILENEGLTMVDFWATWCPPCKMIAPVIEQLAEEFGDRMTVAKIDVDEFNALAADYGVINIPTVIFFKNGTEIRREIGAKGYDDYAEIIEENL